MVLKRWLTSLIRVFACNVDQLNLIRVASSSSKPSKKAKLSKDNFSGWRIMNNSETAVSVDTGLKI